MYARVWWDDTPSAPTAHNSTRALALSIDGGQSFSPGNLSAFVSNPGTDTQGALIAVRMAKADSQRFPALPRSETHMKTILLVGSPWGTNHFPRQNYSILYSEVLSQSMAESSSQFNKGRLFLSPWQGLPGASPLFAGASEYSSLLWPSFDVNTIFVCYERGDSGTAVLHLTQIHLSVF